MQLRNSKQYAEQDKTLSDLEGTVDALTVLSINIESELGDHITILSSVEDKLDENQRLTSRLQTRMVRFVERSSDSCLGCTIFALLGLLGFLVFYV